MTHAQLFWTLKPYVSVISHTTGRLRLDVGLGILKDPAFELAKGLNYDAFKDIKGVKECKVNKILGKITLLYDEELLPRSSLERLINVASEEDCEELLQELLHV